MRIRRARFFWPIVGVNDTTSRAIIARMIRILLRSFVLLLCLATTTALAQDRVYVAY